MESYLVTFVFNVDADTPEQAARDAEGMLTDPSAYPPIATVRAPDGTETDVDLSD